jgi:hypothetical protein
MEILKKIVDSQPPECCCPDCHCYMYSIDEKILMEFTYRDNVFEITDISYPYIKDIKYFVPYFSETIFLYLEIMSREQYMKLVDQLDSIVHTFKLRHIECYYNQDFDQYLLEERQPKKYKLQ